MMRESRFTEIIGMPGSGKTTFLIRFLKRFAQAEPLLVIDPDGNEPAWDKVSWINPADPVAMSRWQSGWRKTQYDPEDSCFKAVIDNFRNGHLVLDDANVYAASRPDDHLKHLLKRKRQFGIDIWSTAHGFTEMPAMFYTYITHYVLFPTLDDPGRRKINIPMFDRLLEIKKAVDLRGIKDRHYHVAFDNFGRIIK